MPCLFAIFGGMFPRLAVLFIWIARPSYFSAAFGDSWFWPILGIIFLPFTTLMYVLLWTPSIGLTSWDWFWLVIAALLDISSIVATANANRDRIPGMSTM